MKYLQCTHEIKENGFCIECGIEIDQIILVDDFSQNIQNNISGKYTLKNPKSYYKTIDKILIPLKLEEYKLQIIYEISNKKFNNKISEQNKILLILYNLLIKDGFPICLNDLLEYSTLKKNQFLKNYRNSFEYCKKPESYYNSIFLRANKFIEKIINSNIKNNLKELNFIDKNLLININCKNILNEKFKHFCQKYPTCNPFTLCVVLLSIENNIVISTKTVPDFPKFVIQCQNIKKIIKKD